jgi:hypothetical protein
VRGEEIKVFGVICPYTQFLTINVFYSDILVKAEALHNPSYSGAIATCI